MSNETHTQTAKRQRDERLAAENARVAADLKRQADELAAAQEASRVSALAQWQAKQDAEAEAAGMRDKALQAVTATMDTPAQAHQQVLKAEPATADATDRVEPANTSPRVGAMGVGQAADAAPSEEPATLNLGTICDRLGFKVTADFLASLGVVHVATDKRAMLYRESQWPLICKALTDHIAKVAAQ